MSTNRSRFDANGELNIILEYYPDEPVGGSGGHSGSGGGRVRRPERPEEYQGQSSIRWSTGRNGPQHGFHPTFGEPNTLVFAADTEIEELSVLVNRETEWAFANLHSIVEKETSAISKGDNTENKNAIDHLINRKKSDIQLNTEKFTKTFGPDPLSKPFAILFRDFFYARTWGQGEIANNFYEWDEAYRAAKSIAILEAKINILNQKSNALANAIAQTNKENAERAKAQRAAEEARQQAEAQWLETQAAIDRQHAQQQAKESAGHAEAIRQAQAAIKAATVAPAIGPASASEASRLGQRIADALKVTALAKHLGPQLAVFAAGMAFPSDLANGELPDSVFTTPLSQLDLPDNANLRELAGIKGNATVSHRLRFNATAGSSPEWALTNGTTVPGEVPVRHVLHNIQNNTYEFTRDGDDQPALIWTPIVSPDNNSTYSPATPPERPGISGFPANPASPELEIYPEADREFLDDYILIFPQDSGCEAQYVMFKSPRYLPGKVSGEGKPFPSNWQDLATSDKGAPISDKVAEILAGRQYSEFRNFKRAIWRETAKIANAEVINNTNFKEMKKGNAPFAPEKERKTGRDRFEIHHRIPISQGGEVYNIENLILLTPKKHDEVHNDMKKMEQSQNE